MRLPGLRRAQKERVMSAPQLQREVAEGETEDGGQLLRRLLESSVAQTADRVRETEELNALLQKPMAPKKLCPYCGTDHGGMLK